MQPDSESIILVDAPSGAGRFESAALESAGHTVVVCHGPAHKTLCPVLKKSGHCDLIESAHGVVFELDLERAQHRAILRRYQEVLREDVPIRVVVNADQASRFAEVLKDVEVWTHEPSSGDLDGFAARVEAFESTLE